MNTEKQFHEEVEVPQGVTVSITEDKVITLKGAKGELVKRLYHPQITLQLKDNKIIIDTTGKKSRKLRNIVTTYSALFETFFIGVTEGHEYKLKICSGHFPMNVTLKNNVLEVKNFIGEAVPRRMAIKPGVDVKMDGEFITVTGLDKELCGNVSAEIEHLTKRTGFDFRRFQDGIYIIEKAGRSL
ncbi:MAG: 50S ribosomal protein L6 [Candidatus Woesearchaeota archaeon]|nr:MAG: 50S ribosomal protein L6 [Candidatus Woesearchaeota archaeon]